MKTKSLIYLAIVFVHTFINLGASTLEPTGAHYALRYTLDASSAQFSPDSSLIVKISGGAVCTCNIETGEQLMSLGDITHAMDAQFSPDSKSIVAALGCGICIYDAFSGDLIIKEESLQADQAKFSPCGQFIAFYLKGSEAGLWDVWKTSNARSWDFKKGYPSDLHVKNGFGLPVSFSPDGRYFGRKNRVSEPLACIRNLSNCEVAVKSGRQIDSYCDSAFSPDGEHILICSRYSESYLFNTKTGKCKLPLKSGSRPVFSRNGQMFSFQLLMEHNVGVWNLEGKCLQKLPSILYGPSFSSSGELIAVIYRHRVSIFDTKTWQSVQVLGNFDGSVSAVQFSPDDRYLMVTVPEENKVFVYENSLRVGNFAQERLVFNLINQGFLSLL
jgi:WD40 repeat protein